MEKQAKFLNNYYLENLLNKLIEEINEENGLNIYLKINADTRKEAYNKINFISAIADLMEIKFDKVIDLLQFTKDENIEFILFEQLKRKIETLSIKEIEKLLNDLDLLVNEIDLMDVDDIDIDDIDIDFDFDYEEEKLFLDFLN